MITASPTSTAGLDPLVAEIIQSQANKLIYRETGASVLREFIPLMQPRSQVPILDFLERTIRYPTGPRAGEKYNRRHQPATSAFLMMLEQPQWRRVNLIGGNQLGKTFSLLQYLIHTVGNGLGEDIGFALPTLDQHWRAKKADVEQLITASSELRWLWPQSGAGSRGGNVPLLRFSNGRRLYAMGSGSNQEQRSSHPMRVVLLDEAKSADQVSAGDEGSTIFAQLENRTRAFAGRQVMFLASTLTTPTNITWRLHVEGTGTQPHFPCDSCGEHISPEMEHLIGWQDAATEHEVRKNTRFVCPTCGWVMSPEQRRAALQNIIPLHRGQKVVDGEVTGPDPVTSTLSYRVPASCNMFADEGELGVALWRHSLEADKFVAEKMMRTIRQGLFGLPAEDSAHVIDELDGRRLMKRLSPCTIGRVPYGTQRLFAGLDVRKSTIHYAVIAFSDDANPVEIDWGSQPILEGKLWDDAFAEAAEILSAKFRDGYPIDGGGTKTVDLESWDSGWKTRQVQNHCEQSDFAYPSMGFGAGVLQKNKYKPRKSSKIVGLDWQLASVADRELLEIDASAWKSRLFGRLRLPTEDKQALLFATPELDSDDSPLRWLVSHLTAEREIQSQTGGELVTIFEQLRTENHLLDSTQLALSAEDVHRGIEELLAGDQPTEIEWDPVQAGW